MSVSKIKENAGYSLVESIVALALLVTVLMPLSSLVVTLVTHRLSKQKIEALTIAQAAMESALVKGQFVDRTENIQDDKWIVTERYQYQEDLVLVEITVLRTGRTRPHIMLQTARLRANE